MLNEPIKDLNSSGYRELITIQGGPVHLLVDSIVIGLSVISSHLLLHFSPLGM